MQHAAPSPSHKTKQKYKSEETYSGRKETSEREENMGQQKYFKDFQKSGNLDFVKYLDFQKFLENWHL